MTATAPALSAGTEPETEPESSAVTPTLRARARTWLGPALLVLLLLLLAAAVGWGAIPQQRGDLDPEGVDPAGSRAVVQVAEDLGTEVDVARSAEAAASAADTETMLVLVHSHRLSRSELESLAEAPGDRLLVQPTTQALELLAGDVVVTGEAGEERLAPVCGLSAATAAGSADIGGELYATEAGEGCYPGQEGHALVRAPRAGGEGTATVFGSGTPLRNADLPAAGNAALALNVLAENDRVVWLIPDAPVPEGQVGIDELVPAGLYPAAAQLAVALLLLALWRSRRMGALVTERLPVVVQAAETTQGRSRLYRARRARDRAGAAMREGFIGRVRPLAGLAPDAAPEAVVEGVAARAGRDPKAVRALLYGAGAAEEGRGAAPADEAELVRLADELDTLEREVRSS